MKRLLRPVIALFIVAFSEISKAEPNLIALSRSVTKILAISANGTQNMGSGVVIGHSEIATNCHVTRTASRAYLIKEDRLYAVLAQAAIPELDVCILKTRPFSLPVAPLANTDMLKTGDDIIVYGYPHALGMRMMTGSVIGLHPYAEDKIIEINTGFKQGSSGGGVFNNEGKLIGLTTFMGKADNHMHFYAVPASWLALGLKQKFVPMQSFTARSFWEKGDFEHVSKH